MHINFAYDLATIGHNRLCYYFLTCFNGTCSSSFILCLYSEINIILLKINCTFIIKMRKDMLPEKCGSEKNIALFQWRVSERRGKNSKVYEGKGREGKLKEWN